MRLLLSFLSRTWAGSCSMPLPLDKNLNASHHYLQLAALGIFALLILFFAVKRMKRYY